MMLHVVNFITIEIAQRCTNKHNLPNKDNEIHKINIMLMFLLISMKKS